MFLPVDNHSCDLLIHEYQDGDQQGGKSRGQVNPPGVPSEGGHKPAPLRTRWLGSRETEAVSASVSCMLTRSHVESLTLNSLGTMSFGVSTPTRASTPQKMSMARMMAKSLMSFLTWVEVNTHLLVVAQPAGGARNCWVGLAHRGGEEGAGLELLQTHGAGVGAKEQDEGHEGDVRDELAGLPHQLSFVLQALSLGEGRPRGVRWLQKQQ